MSEHEKQVANVTVQAVDHIGGIAANEIEQVADSVKSAAAELDGLLRKLAGEVRKHTDHAAGQVKAFVAMAEEATERTRMLHEYIVKESGHSNGGP